MGRIGGRRVDSCCGGASGALVTSRMDKALAGFHHQAVRRMAEMVPKHQRDRTWLYPSIGEAMAMVGLDNIGVYITRHQNTIEKIHFKLSYHGLVYGYVAEVKNATLVEMVGAACYGYPKDKSGARISRYGVGNRYGGIVGRKILG